MKNTKYSKQLLTAVFSACFMFFSVNILTATTPIMDDCLIRTDIEPKITFQNYRPVSATSLEDDDAVIWDNMDAAMIEDGNIAVTSLEAFQTSEILDIKSFYADVPVGATIHGVQVRFTGASTHNQFLEEKIIQFHLNGNPIGTNMAGKSTISNPWKVDLHQWDYGYQFSDWGIEWSRDLLINPELSLRVAVENTSDEIIEAFLDRVEIIVHYTPLYTLCSHDCVVFYNDPVAGATEYIWDVPEGVKFLNDNPGSSIVNLDFSNAPMGLLDLGLTIVANGDTISCNRNLLHNICEPASIGNFVWFDENFDGQQDIDELGVSGVNLNILDPYGNEIASTTTNANGMYQFTDLEKGFYFIELEANGFAASPMNATNNDEDSDLNANFESNVFYVRGGDSIVNVDFGLFDEGSISGTIFTECDGDGILNNDDSVTPNVLVQLWRGSTIFSEQITDTDGTYTFDGLTPGDYRLKIISDQDVSENTNSNNPSVENVFGLENEVAVSVGLGEDLVDIDGALNPDSRLQVQVYFDENENNTIDAGENIFDGQIIELFFNGEVIDSAVIVDGEVMFEEMAFMAYSLRMAENPDYQLYETTDYNSEVFNGELLVSAFDIDCLNDNLVSLRFREVGNMIGDFIWEDLDFDGLQDPGEPGISGVLVRLVNFTTAELEQEVTTDIDGRYEFMDVPAGSYVIFLEFTGEYDVTLINQDENLGSKLVEVADIYTMGPINVEEGDVLLNWDAGVTEKQILVSDLVWIDENRNNLYDDGERGLSDVRVSLHTADGSMVAETTTNESGQYEITTLAGTYYVQFEHEEYVDFVEFGASLDSSIDSDVDPSLGEGRTGMMTMLPGEVRTDVDAGYIPRTGFVGDFVFLDLNENGVQEDDEIGLSNFLVEVYNVAGEVVESTTTEEGGYYQLEVEPGTYYLKYTKSGFDTPSPNILGNNDTNSDITNDFGPNTTGLITIDLFEVNDDIDAGFLTISTLIGDYVWQDFNSNGLQDESEIGLGNMNVNLIKIGEGLVETTVTANGSNGERGYYEFLVDQPGDYYIQFVLPDNSWSFTIPNMLDDDLDSDVSLDNGIGTTATFFLEPGEHRDNIDAGAIGVSSLVGDFVWKDENNNGLQDSGEPGINGMNVFLYDEFFNFVDVTITMYNSSTQTDGYYEFDDLDAGNYIVVFDTEDPFATAYVGSDELVDSDVTNEFVKGSTGLITLVTDQKSFSIDAGVMNADVPNKGSIGDMVWDDENKNGIFETGEQGMSGVAIELLNENGELVAETESDNNGFYTFNSIEVGTYKIYAELPDGYTYTVPNNSFDDDTDSDIQSSGETLFFSLAGGQEIKNIDIGFTVIPGENGVIYNDGEQVETEFVEDETDVVIEFQESNPIGFDRDGLLTKDFTVFPNPARTQARMTYPLYKSSATRIQLINAQGKVIQQVYRERLDAGNHQMLFDLTAVEAGSYFIRLTTDDSIRFKKLIVQ